MVFLKTIFLVFFSLNIVTVSTKHLINLSGLYWVISYISKSALNIKFFLPLSSIYVIHLQRPRVIKATPNTFTTKEVENKPTIVVSVVASALCLLARRLTFNIGTMVDSLNRRSVFSSIFPHIGISIYSHIRSIA